jgi:hypothetical protein
MTIVLLQRQQHAHALRYLFLHMLIYDVYTSLQGLLNVLDGVVDTPGRIVIMTRYTY